jgi:hypothetical protein
MIAGGMLGDDLTLEDGEGVGEQRFAAASCRPLTLWAGPAAARGRRYGR